MTNPIYIISNNKEDPTSGMYAITDADGDTMVQIFLNKDDAVGYNIHLEALDQELHVCEVLDGDPVYSLCEMMGYGSVTIKKGEVVVPRIETLKSDLFNRSQPS